MIFLVLSVKGVEWDEMGYIGTTAKKITGVVKGIGLLAVTNLGMLRSLTVTNFDTLQSLARELWGIEKTSGDIEEAASNPGSQAILPSYVSFHKEFLIGF